MEHSCCVQTCFSQGKTLHRLPNPNVDLDRFRLWIALCGNSELKTLNPDVVYRSRRICHDHFEQHFVGPNQVLRPNAFPTVLLPVQLRLEEGDVVEVDNDDEMKNEEFSDDQDVTDNCRMPPPSEATTSTFGQNKDEDVTVQVGTLRRTKVSLRNKVNITRSAQLASKAKFLYSKAVHFQRQLRSTKFQNSTLRRRIKLAEKFSQSVLFTEKTSITNCIVRRLFKSQLENVDKKPRARRFTTKDKVLALALFKQSGSAYRFLSKLFLLPSRKILTTFLNKIPIEPGINECVLKVLESKAKSIKKKTGKFCILMFDEMSICSNLSYYKKRDIVQGFEDFGYKRTEKIANHVQVFMLRNIEAKWKQPIFYNFVNGATNHSDIEKILELLITKLADIGLIVCATVCDQGTNNSSAIQNLIEKTEEDYLRRGQEMRGRFFEVAGYPVIPLFDPPHLLMGIRNNLLVKDLKCSIDGIELIAKWDHIYNAYLIDGVFGELRSMSKINDNHVHPQNLKKMKVSCCTKLFSQKVAAIVNHIAKWGTTAETDQGILKLPSEAIQTAQVIIFLDKLFDSVNGHADFDVGGKPLRTCITDKSPHIEFWKKAIVILKTMRFVNQDGKLSTPPSVKNWITTLQGFIDLYVKMKSFGFKKMCPRTFNQDALENFFGQIRQRGVRFTNPTVAAFTPFYASLSVNNFTKDHSVDSNCENDEGDILISLQEFVTQDVEDEAQQLVSFSDSIQVPTKFKKVKKLESAVMHYVSDFISKKVLPKVRQCEICKGSILAEENASDSVDEATKVFTENKEYDSKKRLKYCSTKFIEYLTNIYNIFNFIFPKICHLENIMERIAEIIKKNIKFPFTNECQHDKAMEDLIIHSLTRILLFHNIRTLNNIMLGKDKRSVHQAPAIFKAAALVYQKTRKSY